MYEPEFIEFGIQITKAVLGIVLIALPIGWLVISHTWLNPNKGVNNG